MADGDPGLRTVAWGSPSEAPEASGGPVSTRVRLEITTRLSEELARFGSVGSVQLQGSDVVLLHPTGVRRAPLDEWLHHWDLLDEPTRRLRVSQLARSLARPTSLPVSRPPRAASAFSVSPWLLAGGLAAATAVGALWLLGDFGSAKPEPPPRAAKAGAASTAATTTPGSSQAVGAAAGPVRAAAGDESRASLVCAATRARVVRGATVSVADTEGWVVEYMGFRLDDGASPSAPLHESPALATFFETPTAPGGSRYVWRDEPDLATTPTSEDRVLVRPEVISGTTPPPHSGVRITFGGALVDAYFRPDTRAAYFHLATALSDALGASEAALYARCADGNSHHLGSWFRGRNHNEAVTALLYVLGTFADPPHLGDAFLRPLGSVELDRAHAFATISRVASAIDRPLLANLVGREGGMVMGRPGEVVTLTFPFDDGNRASRLSREIARLTEIGGQ